MEGFKKFYLVNFIRSVNTELDLKLKYRVTLIETYPLLVTEIGSLGNTR